MSYPRRISCLLALACAVVVRTLPAAEDADAVRDFNQAVLEHERATATALAPVNRDHAAKLEQLRARAEKAGDVDLTARIQQAQEKLAAKPPSIEGLGPKADFIGDWVYLLLGEGRTGSTEFQPDGTWNDRGRRLGTWVVSDNQLVVNFDEHRDWHDHYDLPIRDGVLQGHNSVNLHMQLTRRGVPPSESARAELVGEWKFRNYHDNYQYTATINADGSYHNSGKRVGHWMVGSDNRLYINYDEHPNWHDSYDLPPNQGELRGRNMNGDPLQLSRALTPQAMAQPPAPSRVWATAF